nr:molybdopterin-binding protein [Jannaschia sp. S6380]
MVIAVDWSAAARPTGPRPCADAIWVCADLNGVRTTRYHATRHAALAEVEEWLALGHRTLLTFDFAMGYPQGFARTLTGRAEALAVWDWLATHVRDGPDNANNRFEVAQTINRAFPGIGPLWGRPDGHDLPDLPARGRARSGHGIGDHRAVEAFARAAQSVLKLYTAGAVGGQSLVGLAALARLRARHPDLAVWPQETGFAVPPARVVLAEIYPSLWCPVERAIKDEGQVLAAVAALRDAPETWFTAPGAQPDADRIAAEEGWILGVLPPADCFALPPGEDWTPVDRALTSLRAATPTVVRTETIAVGAATGRILAADVIARRSNPPHANAAVDGWAFAHATLAPGPVALLPGRAAAGRPYAGQVPSGHAIRILTGAAIPAGTDTVALQEDATVRDGHLLLRAVPARGANTREAGEDVTTGDTCLSAGAVLRPADIALTIAAGHGTLQVHARLRVGVLSTGDELVAPGADGGTADVNRPMLLSMLAAWHLDPVDLGHAPDDPEVLAVMLDAAGTDAILTSGGASAGDEDHLSRLLRERGDVVHWRIAIKPGRPLALGRWNGTPLFGLPGNPVAALTCAAIFARPALLQMAGAGWREPVGLTVPAAFAKRKRAGRREILRARLRNGAAEVFRSEGSGLVSGLSWAEGFVELPDGAAEIAPGDPVRYIPFAELGLG